MADKHQDRSPLTDRLHALEHSAVDAYHVLEDHNAAELKQDVNGLLNRLSVKVKYRARLFWAWYRAQPLPLRFAYGLTLLPLAAVVGLVLVFVVKFGGPLLLALALALKLLISFGKTLVFIGYIGYKIVKTLLMWYYTISRMYLGYNAKRRRQIRAQNCDFVIESQPPATAVDFRCAGKNLYITAPNGRQTRVLFSYLRYALIGQRELWQDFKRGWRHCLTPWRSVSRDAITQALSKVGASMFTPHTLGAHVTAERILVPGDAELLSLQFLPSVEGGFMQLRFRVRWVNWRFELRQTPWFLRIERQPANATWVVLEHAAANPIPNTSVIADSANAPTDSVNAFSALPSLRL